jgi:dihydrofolate reductase
MRKVKLFIATSLDSFIATTDGGVDWLFGDRDYGYRDFYNSIDTTLMGNNTYKQILEFGVDFPYTDKTNYVFSKQPQKDTEFVSFIGEDEDLVSFVVSLKQKEGKDIWLIGGGEINAFFLSHHLIDEMILSVHPVILGPGLPLFAGQLRQQDLRLLNCKTFPSGLAQLVYGVLPEESFFPLKKQTGCI